MNQSTRDALADAEQLASFHDIGSLSTARHLGSRAADLLVTGSDTDGYGNTADRLAFYAARAAFRAVRGLRG